MDHFHSYIDLYKDAAGGMVGQRGIQYILTDSYEAEQMTWTRNMAAEFSKRKGYDLLRWLPALTGEIMETSEKTEAFLWDWRDVIGDLFAENYCRINDIVKEYDMRGRYTESHELGRLFVGDGMDIKMTATVPMSAIWMENTPTGHRISFARMDIMESASTAHIFGQNIAAAESFTVSGIKGRAYVSSFTTRPISRSMMRNPEPDFSSTVNGSTAMRRGLPSPAPGWTIWQEAVSCCNRAGS